MVLYIKPDNTGEITPLPNEEERSGLFSTSLRSRGLSLFSGNALLLPYSQFPLEADSTRTKMTFSPDEKNVLIFFNTSEEELVRVYLIALANPASYLDVTLSYQTLLERWSSESTELHENFIAAQHQRIRDSLSKGAHIVQFSPDKKKILYLGIGNVTLDRVIRPPIQGSSPVAEHRSIEPGKLYVYDIKEDKNYELDLFPTQQKNLQEAANIAWFSNSKHLVFSEADTISTVEYDAQNRTVIYSGPFEQSLLATTSDERILILTNLNPRKNNLPDLYAISIK